MDDGLQVIIFESKSISEITESINSWLRRNPEMKVSTVNQSVTEWRIIISVWYYDKPKEGPRD